jgi:biotin-dependent carboxylase-like uncharacterized protein
MLARMTETRQDCFIEVIEGGLQTTIQDLGRTGLLATGMPPSGAFDSLALQQANLLVENDVGDSFLVGSSVGDAGLEILLFGPKLRFSAPTAVAVTGADLGPTLNGGPLPMYETVQIEAGDLLAFEAPKRGARSYLAVVGGIDVPLVLGSRSTNVRARIGGFQGRRLLAGDRIALNAPHRRQQGSGRAIPVGRRPHHGPPWELRVVLGPQHELFEGESLSLFLGSDWRLQMKSDRMGCRFSGPALAFKPRPDYLVAQAGSDPSNIVDDAIPVGGIQVPSGLEAIVMGVDGPSLGGYAKIGTLISADLARLAQICPGEPGRFRAVSLAEALAARAVAAEARSNEVLAVSGP